MELSKQPRFRLRIGACPKCGAGNAAQIVDTELKEYADFHSEYSIHKLLVWTDELNASDDEKSYYQWNTKNFAMVEK